MAVNQNLAAWIADVGCLLSEIHAKLQRDVGVDLGRLVCDFNMRKPACDMLRRVFKSRLYGCTGYCSLNLGPWRPPPTPATKMFGKTQLSWLRPGGT